MKNEMFELSEAYQSVLDEIPPAQRIKVVLMDSDNLPMARGTAVLPIAAGNGLFWPDCPMPGGQRLSSAKCFTLPAGEVVKVKTLKLKAGTPPHYEFTVALA